MRAHRRLGLVEVRRRRQQAGLLHQLHHRGRGEHLHGQVGRRHLGRHRHLEDVLDPWLQRVLHALDARRQLEARTAPATGPPSENSCRSVHFCAHPHRTSADGARRQDADARPGIGRARRSGLVGAAAMPERREDRRTLQSVSIALDVIDALAAAPELSLSELARRIGVAKSTAHRTCSVLAERACSTGRPPAATASACASSSTGTWRRRAPPSRTVASPAGRAAQRSR